MRAVGVVKSVRGAVPVGPYAVSADEIDDVTALQVQSFVNGEPRQNAPVKELIFDIPELIAWDLGRDHAAARRHHRHRHPRRGRHWVRPAQVHGLR